MAHNPSSSFEMLRLSPGLTSDPSTGRAGEVYFNSTTNSLRYYDGSLWQSFGGTWANQQLSNLIGPTAINADLLPAATGTSNIGNASLIWLSVNATNLASVNSIVDDSGANGITIAGNAAAVNTNSGQMSFTSGAASGTGNTGRIFLQTGTPSGSGTQGSIDLDGQIVRLLKQSTLQWMNSANTFYVGFAAPSSITANTTWILPNADGSSDQFLQTNGAGQLQWATVNLSAYMINPMTTAGDIIYENSTPAPARLGIGTTGQILTVVGGFPAWAAAPATGANTALSNLASTAVNASIIPASNNAITLGTSGTLQFLNANFLRSYSAFSPDLLVSGLLTGIGLGISITGVGIAQVGQGDYNLATNPLYVITGSDAVNNAIATAPITIQTGSKTAGTGNSGSILLLIGTSSGGTAGSIQFQDGSQGTSGYVWTSKDTVGSGHWAAASASGANTALSNLSAVAINTSLLPGTSNGPSLGSSTLLWNTVFASTVSIYSGGSGLVNIGPATAPTGGQSGAGLYGANTAENLIFYTEGGLSSSPSVYFETGPVNSTGANATGQFSVLTGPQQNASGTGATGAINLTTGNNTGLGSSGNILLAIGTGSTRGSIRFQDGSQGTAGYVWTSKDTIGSGEWSAAAATTPSSGALGSVQLSDGSGAFTSDATNYWWDTANHRLGIGTNVPSYQVVIQNNTNGAGTPMLYVNSTASSAEVDNIILNSAANTGMRITNTGLGLSAGMYIGNSGGATANFQISNTSAGTLALSTIGQNGLITLTAAGKIQLIDGTQGTAGYVWTSIDASGTGSWLAASAGFANPMTTAGDIIYESGTPAPARLGIGSTGQVLEVVAGLPAWTTPPAWQKDLFVLNSTNITNQYVDLTYVAVVNSIQFAIQGAPEAIEGSSYDYTVSYTGGAGGVTRITFQNGLATGGAYALVATNVIVLQYQY